MTSVSSTPREIDEALAALWHKRADAETSLGHSYSHMHSVLRERSTYVTRTRKTWPTTHAEATDKVIAALAALDAHYAETGTWVDAPGPIAPYDRDAARRSLTNMDTRREEIGRLSDEIEKLETEYRRRPWSRFFVVTSSSGHVHSSMHCHTCRPSTTYGWLPELSGQTEADAVAKLGPALCSVCFPSAPVAHQEKKITKAQAEKLAA